MRISVDSCRMHNGRILLKYMIRRGTALVRNCKWRHVDLLPVGDQSFSVCLGILRSSANVEKCDPILFWYVPSYIIYQSYTNGLGERRVVPQDGKVMRNQSNKKMITSDRNCFSEDRLQQPGVS
jgi:hypothetical protein